MNNMLEYIRDPTYELALSGGVMYSYVAYLGYVYECSQLMTYTSLLLALTSIWFHSTKSVPSFWVDQISLNTWVVVVTYEAYVRNWMLFAMALLCIAYAILIFYVGQLKNTYAYHPSRFWSIFFHHTVHLSSSIVAIFMVTMFPGPK